MGVSHHHLYSDTPRQAREWEGLRVTRGRLQVRSGWRVLLWGSRRPTNYNRNRASYVFCFGSISGSLWLVLLWKWTEVGKLQSWTQTIGAGCCRGGGAGLPGLAAADGEMAQKSVVIYHRAIVWLYSQPIAKVFNLFLYGLCSLCLI